MSRERVRRLYVGLTRRSSEHYDDFASHVDPGEVIVGFVLRLDAVSTEDDLSFKRS